MTASLKPWWRNCALQPDPEIAAIDRLEAEIVPIAPNVSKIRELISGFELCHHKADRWVQNIIEAIGTGETDSGLGTRTPGRRHPAEKVWQNACAALAAWCAGCPSAEVEMSVGALPASELLGCLGERSPLKEWQVQRVIEKIRNSIHWPQSQEDPTAQYVWLLLGGSEYELAYRKDCPDHYREHGDFWLATVRTMIHDTEGGNAAELSLALAIDMLWPCHWRFVENLKIVLAAIGGTLNPAEPFAACGRNISLFPGRSRMEVVSNTLSAYYKGTESAGEVDRELLDLLGEPTKEKKWLAASLEKTIRLQLDPPTDLRAISALRLPDSARY